MRYIIASVWIRGWMDQLRTLISAKYDQRHWTELLPHLIHSLNAAVHSTTTYSAFELLYGRWATHFLQELQDVGPVAEHAIKHQRMQRDA
jgi:hypothetical protein